MNIVRTLKSAEKMSGEGKEQTLRVFKTLRVSGGAARRAVVVRVIVLLAALWMPLHSAAAQSAASFTLTLPSAFARAQPNMTSQRSASLFQGRTYAINARTADSLWVRVNYTGALADAWVQASFGTISGNLAAVPVVVPGEFGAPAGPVAGAAAPGQPAAGGQTAQPVSADVYQPDAAIIPHVSQTAREIYQAGLARGNNPRAFSKIGDCQSVPPYFLAAFDYGPQLYSLGPHGHLQETIDYFKGSFARNSVASNAGFNVATVFVPLWADPVRCQRNESPLACELRINRPSFAIISMETWWGGDPAGYESYMRRIIEYTISRGTVPILGTKADNIEGDGSINAVIVKLAQEYDIPLWNFWAAVQPLPAHGLHPDGFHLTWERNHFDSPTHMQQAWPVRNLTALQALDAVRRGVSE